MTERRQRRVWFWAGIACMIISVVPNIILGENSIFTYHDQLDGELIAYILQAKHLFQGDVLPEFLGGMSKTSLTLPAPAFVLLFLWMDSFSALALMQFLGRLTAFVGMYLLAGEVTGNSKAAAAAGVLYGLLPFLPVYGLSQYGIPLLFWCARQIEKKKNLLISYGYVAFYALTSSLVLAGFGLLGMGAAVMLWKLWTGRAKKDTKAIKGANAAKNAKAEILRLLGAWLLLLGIYVAENFRLLAQMLGIGAAGVSHKAEYALSAQPFWSAFLRNICIGGQHSEGFQKLLLLALAVSLPVSFFAVRVTERKRFYLCGSEGWKRIIENIQCLGVCAGWILLFSATAALWVGSAGVALRSHLGALGAFQLERLLWIAPSLWYLAFAAGFAVLERLWRECGKRCGKMTLAICLALVAAAAGITGGRIVLAGDVKSNIQKIRNPDYGLLSFRDYYGTGVMEQVRDFLAERTGEGQEAYSVVSLGIDPAAALYHGFYCLDGYSNNYALEYKHAFREIIAPELERSDYLRNYYDTWGNRCYLFSSECPGYYTIEKHGFYFQDYRLNVEALRGMGCDYLLSAAYIQNADEQGLVLLNETPFETEDSYYCIYVYWAGGERE